MNGNSASGQDQSPEGGPEERHGHHAGAAPTAGSQSAERGDDEDETTDKHDDDGDGCEGKHDGAHYDSPREPEGRAAPRARLSARPPHPNRRFGGVLSGTVRKRHRRNASRVSRVWPIADSSSRCPLFAKRREDGPMAQVAGRMRSPLIVRFSLAEPLTSSGPLA